MGGGQSGAVHGVVWRPARPCWWPCGWATCWPSGPTASAPA